MFSTHTSACSISVVRAKIAEKILRIMELFVLPKQSLLRRLLPSIEKGMSSQAAGLMVDLVLNTYEVLFEKRAWAEEGSVNTGSDADSLSTLLLPVHERDLWYVFAEMIVF